MSLASASPETFDVLIVGAGLSGIGAAYHVTKHNPGVSYAILEARSQIGGTWDLFRYPGVRSDSDMYTLGYSFRPWTDARAIAEGPAILRYLGETVKELRLEDKIRLAHKVVSAAWSSADSLWTLEVERTDTDEKATLKCRFLLMCSGYYDYDAGYTPDFPGLSRFRGELAHPQKWKADTRYADQRVIVIGSGATAVTLVPELAKTAKHVVMVQRSPSYIASLPSVDPVARLARRLLPSQMAHTLIRWKNILIAMAFFRFCRAAPKLARRLLLFRSRRELREGVAQARDFAPTYAPWDQRLCLVPDGDIYRALNSGKAEIVTDTIETFTETGIRVSSGREIAADLIITATGLQIKYLGGIALQVDGRAIDLTQVVPYKGTMLSGVPNLAMAFGYTNASWTLKCDLICEWVGRILHFMRTNDYTAVTPDGDPDIKRVPLIDFSSGYIERAKNILPRQGTQAPWTLSQNYFADLIAFRARPLADDGLRFT